MFTGLVKTLGTVREVQEIVSGRQLVIAAPAITANLTLGESVAVNGACLTVVERDAESCRFEVGPETILRTNLGALRVGDRVNLERALRMGDRLGGHLVQGHVDAVGTITRKDREGDWVIMSFNCPAALTIQMVPKGSIAVDGISLTLVDVAADGFSIMLIPHTLANTTLGFKDPGAIVNLETDLLAKYVQKAVETRNG